MFLRWVSTTRPPGRPQEADREDTVRRARGRPVAGQRHTRRVKEGHGCTQQSSGLADMTEGDVQSRRSTSGHTRGTWPALVTDRSGGFPLGLERGSPAARSSRVRRW